MRDFLLVGVEAVDQTQSAARPLDLGVRVGYLTLESQFADRLRGRPAEIYTYPGAGHAFHEDFRPEVYRPVAATTAWARSLEYLSYYLRDNACYLRDNA